MSWHQVTFHVLSMFKGAFSHCLVLCLSCPAFLLQSFCSVKINYKQNLTNLGDLQSLATQSCIIVPAGSVWPHIRGSLAGFSKSWWIAFRLSRDSFTRWQSKRFLTVRVWSRDRAMELGLIGATHKYPLSMQYIPGPANPLPDTAILKP